MAAIDHVYLDASLTTQFDDATHTLDLEAVDSSSADGSFYVGTPTSGNKVEAASDPGVDPIVCSIVHAVAEWSASEAILANDERRPTTHNGYVYEAQGSGTTGGSEPTWPTTIGGTVADNGITWECVRAGPDEEDIKVALSSGGLDGATGGASLNVATTINYGSPVQVFHRWTNDSGSGTSTDISLQLSARAESAI